jgi:hypothetical protein
MVTLIFWHILEIPIGEMLCVVSLLSSTMKETVGNIMLHVRERESLLLDPHYKKML